MWKLSFRYNTGNSVSLFGATKVSTLDLNGPSSVMLILVEEPLSRPYVCLILSSVICMSLEWKNVGERGIKNKQVMIKTR